MGKTKWYTEPETTQQQGSRPGTKPVPASNTGRRRNVSPGRFMQETADTVPIPVLLRQIVLRLRRTWIAFRFRANHYTLGLFRKQAALKVGVLGFAAYFLLFTDHEIPMFPDRSEFGTGTVVETTLDVGGNEPVGKAARWDGKNEAAPVSTSDLAEGQAREYIQRFSDIAVKEMEKFGIPASISLAQGLVESRAGSSKLARRNNNHFGMKCFSKKCAKGHCSNFTDDHHKDFFRIYKNPWESWRAHSQMLASGRYTALKKYRSDYKKWAYGLKTLGYATDRTYAEKLIGVIERYDLHRYDR